MPKLEARKIFELAMNAGFTPDEAVTMTAIALAESTGVTDAHNPNNEDSWGLWQINLDAHRNADWAQGLDLRVPENNALAAFHVSRGAEDISRWTVTHRDRGAPYLQHMETARAAAREAGYDALGNAHPPQNYDDHRPAAFDPAEPQFEAADFGRSTVTPPVGPAPDDAGPAGGGGEVNDGTLAQFLDAALQQQGDVYVFGAETDMSDADPTTFDCSELVEWAAHQAGVDVIDGSHNQYDAVRNAGLELSVEEALRTPGALLFRFSPAGGHVAISLGDGRTIEARGSKYGVGIFDAGDRFELAGLIPGIDYDGSSSFDAAQLATTEGAPAFAPDNEQLAYAAAHAGEGDSDGDLLADHLEVRLGLDPASDDSDGDGITDGYEILVAGTRADRTDTDFDGVDDDVELALGTDPLKADHTAAGAAAVVPSELQLDSDGDGLSDYGEELAGTDPHDADSDDDLQLDGFEIGAGSDPLDPSSTAALADPLANAEG